MFNPTLPTVSFAPVEYMICNWKLVVAKKVRYIFFLSYVKEIVITLGSCEENGKLIQLLKSLLIMKDQKCNRGAWKMNLFTSLVEL